MSEVRSINFIKPEFGKPVKQVPSWSFIYDFTEADALCDSIEPGEWLPVTLEDLKKAQSYQLAALHYGTFNALRRKNVVYIQSLNKNEKVEPQKRRRQVAESKEKAKKRK